MAATLASNYGIFGPVYELMYHEPYPGKEEEYLNSGKIRGSALGLVGDK